MIDTVLKEKARLINEITEKIQPSLHSSGFSKGIGVEGSLHLTTFGKDDDGKRIFHAVGPHLVEGFTEEPAMIMYQDHPVPALVTQSFDGMYYEDIYTLHKLVMKLKEGDLQ